MSNDGRPCRKLAAAIVAVALVPWQGAASQGTAASSPSGSSGYGWHENRSDGLVVAALGEPETVSDAYFACHTASKRFEVGVQAARVASIRGIGIRVSVNGQHFDLPVVRQEPDDDTIYFVARTARSSPLLPALRSARRISFSLIGVSISGVLKAGGSNGIVGRAIDACH